jgi:predicted metalloprotease with PDZ domain
VRQQSKGKRSLADVYRALFNLGRLTAGDANEIVIETLNRIADNTELTERYVKQGGEIDLAAAIAPFGLEIAPGGARTHIVVAAQLTRAQRDLLHQIGYNERAGQGHVR